MPATHKTAQPTGRAHQKALSDLAIGLILASVLLQPAYGQDPPRNLAKLVAQRESATEAERSEYTYRQTVIVEELDDRGAIRGTYREVRDVIFSPTHDRTEVFVGKPENRLRSLRLTDEDFSDIRTIQPLALTEDTLWNYEVKFKGSEQMEDRDCWVLQVRPRQILQGQRFFDGLLWVDKTGYDVVRLEGQAVPQVQNMKSENLFPRFTTIRKPIDGKHWFPTYTFADDTLQFRNGPLRERLRISYTDYKRFSTESTFKPQ